MFTLKNNLKHMALTSLVLVSVLSSGMAINTSAQDNKSPIPAPGQDPMCVKVKDNLTTKFDLNKEKQEATPFKLQAFLDKKIKQAKVQGDNSPRLDNTAKELTDKLKESEVSYTKLFEIFEKIKTVDCGDFKVFQELIKQARDNIQEIRMQSMTTVMDTRRQLPILTRPQAINQENPNNNPIPQPRPANKDQPSKDPNMTPNQNKNNPAGTK